MVDQTKESTSWSNFKAQLKDIWVDLKDKDLGESPDSFDQLVDSIDNATAEKRDEVQRKVEFLVDRFNIPLEP